MKNAISTGRMWLAVFACVAWTGCASSNASDSDTDTPPPTTTAGGAAEDTSGESSEAGTASEEAPPAEAPPSEPVAAGTSAPTEGADAPEGSQRGGAGTFVPRDDLRTDTQSNIDRMEGSLKPLETVPTKAGSGDDAGSDSGSGDDDAGAGDDAPPGWDDRFVKVTDKPAR